MSTASAVGYPVSIKRVVHFTPCLLFGIREDLPMVMTLSPRKVSSHSAPLESALSERMLLQ